MKKSRSFIMRLLLLVAVTALGCLVGSNLVDAELALAIALTATALVAVNYIFNFNWKLLNVVYVLFIGGIIGFLKPNTLLYAIILAAAALSLLLIYFGYTGHKKINDEDEFE